MSCVGCKSLEYCFFPGTVELLNNANLHLQHPVRHQLQPVEVVHHLNLKKRELMNYLALTL